MKNPNDRFCNSYTNELSIARTSCKDWIFYM
jgi:hypothetical protein